MITFREEPFEQSYPDAIPLLDQHHQEISKFPELELDPDVAKYIKLSKIGMYQTFTVRTHEGALIGYAAFFVSQMMHFRHNTQAVCDLIYLSPEYRKQGVGREFISFIISVFQAKKVDVMMINVPDKMDWSPLLKGLSFTIHDHMYSRRLS